MRSEFTAISAFSTVIAFTAGVVLCMQVTHFGVNPGLDISVPVLWSVEAMIFGTAVLAWRSGVTLPGWVMGVAVLLLVRAALSAAAGIALEAMQSAESVAVGIEQTSALVPRICAAIFSLMVCYPFRVLLPLRPPRARGGRRRFAESAAVKSAMAATEEGDRGLLIVTVKDRPRADQVFAQVERQHAVPDVVPLVDIEGSIELPLRAVLARLPQELVTEKARAMGESQRVSIPLEVILPQLREAQVVCSAAEIRGWLPSAARKAIAQPSDSGFDSEGMRVQLPLELIVPELPPEALALPPPSPPAWAEVDEPDHVVFATI